MDHVLRRKIRLCRTLRCAREPVNIGVKHDSHMQYFEGVVIIRVRNERFNIFRGTSVYLNEKQILLVLYSRINATGENISCLFSILVLMLQVKTDHVCSLFS